MSYLLRQLRPRFPYGSGVRYLASKGAAPGQSSNVTNPRSSNPESQAINMSRGKESRHDDTPDTKSVQSPISSQRGPASERHEGEEPSTTTEYVYNDPAKSAREKRENVEQAGKTALGPEDKK
ncbi:RTA1 domain protein [Aspergillus terreus]|uniref:RTA1 domain protein n=1 Tax=Aspergillus terreus TaxID=33178 RepID=A0A5M3YN44_ASPTE|nr:hypothetical protein ATETN484_0001031400 [Aspergillus terreus]GFF12170.1 RTA1 domain protein [Aspergillus terreus]